MSKQRIYDIGSLNLAVSPLLQKAGDLVRSVNVDNSPIGGQTKRSGYATYLGTMPNGSSVQDLMTWANNTGTQFWNYAFAGGLLYYSTQGTGNWTIAGNGTFSPLGTLTSAVLENTLYVCDGVGTINYTTTGTSFINNGTVLYNGTSTTPAPIAVSLLEYQQRIYAAGTSSFLNWSNVGTGNDWTNDSTSALIPGAGKLTTLFKSNDRLVATKNSGLMFRYDGVSLLDMSTTLGPTSSRSVGNIEDFRIYLNSDGFYGYGGDKPKQLSVQIERQLFNDSGNAVAGTVFPNAPAVAHVYDYLCTVGTTTDDLTGETVAGCVELYDYRYNDWRNYSLAHTPSAWLSYRDASGNKQLAFSNGSQNYQFSGSLTTDAGTPIPSVTQGVLTFDSPESDKEWKYVWASFNPGAQARVQIALANTFTKGKLNWYDLGDCSDGVAEFRFPANSRSKLLMWRITDNSSTDRFTFYGFTIEATTLDRN